MLLYGKEHYKEILLANENFFTVEQNYRVYAQSSTEACKLVPRTERGHYPVWWGVYDGVTSLHFC